MTKTITGATKAWMTYGNDLRSLDEMTPGALVGTLGYASGDMTAHGWIAIGEAEITPGVETVMEIEAEITLRMPDHSVLLQNQIEALRTQQRDALNKAEEFEQRINNLLAISYTPEAA